MRLALDTHTPSDVLDRATNAISEAIGVRCSFIEGENTPAPAPGCIDVVVTTDDAPVGALVIAENGLCDGSIGISELQELADLVGICLLNASQAQAVAELQDDSEDMLFYAPDAIFALSIDGKIEMANQRAISFLDLQPDAILGQNLIDICGTALENSEVLRETARRGGVLELEIHCGAGTRLAALTLSIIGDEQPERILCILRDITAERQAGLALRKTERVTLMGQAVEYLLHEMNNPLAALLANIALARKRSNEVEALLAKRALSSEGSEPGDLGEDAASCRLLQLRKALQNAERSAARIKDTMSMLRSAHRGESWTSVDLVDPRYELTLAVSTAEQESSGNIVFLKKFESQRQVRAPMLALAEALSALLKNAVQALDGIEGGRIEVWAREAADTLIVTVTDNGPGVMNELKDQIFMPFFTTKPLGEALGLGLTLAEDTIRRLGGNLNLIGGGKGATFEFTVPITPSSQ
jgi:signal transduction histidine kinase